MDPRIASVTNPTGETLRLYCALMLVKDTVD
jgi:hypothetical protein